MIESVLLNKSGIGNELKTVAEKIIASERINEDEGMLLYEKADLSLLAMLADYVREKENGKFTYYIKNIHIEPTNICIYNCRFCSYSRKEGEAGSWEMTIEEIIGIINKALKKNISEIHIVGGVHPERDIYYYAELLNEIKNIARLASAKRAGEIHIKAFTAIELDYMFRKSGKTNQEGFEILKEAGLNSIPGGGAEIFSEDIRKQICKNKPTGNTWLEIHEAAHQCGIPSNATMLYGHIESYRHRIDHLEQLRQLQDRTGMFNAFIPLKYRNKNNELSSLKEVSITEDLRNYAICRIYLDNIRHLKAYWPMIGKGTTQLSLSFGVDDIDGTIEDSTRIYSMAGVEEQYPVLTTEEINKIAIDAKRIPAERDSLYNIIKETYS